MLDKGDIAIIAIAVIVAILVGVLILLIVKYTSLVKSPSVKGPIKMIDNKLSKFEFEELLGRWKHNDETLNIERSGNNVNVTATGISPFTVMRNSTGSFLATPIFGPDKAPYTIEAKNNTLIVNGAVFAKVQ